MSDVFISYSRKDKEFVRQLHAALVARQRDVWVDWEDIPPSADWRAEIYAAIESADAFLFVLSPDSIASAVCGEELAHAVRHQKRLVPMVCHDVEPQSTPAVLAALNWIFARAPDDLAQAIATLNTTLDTDLDWVKAHTRLLTRAIEWENKKRDDSLVLRGRDLRDAEEWLAQSASGKEPKPTPLQSQYILVSRQAANARQRIILGAVTVALIITIILAVVALFQRNEAQFQTAVARTAEAQAVTERNIAQSREIIALANAQASANPQLSVLLALEAARLARTSQAEDALRSLVLLPEKLTIATQAPVFEAAFSPDGKYLLLMAANMPAQIREVSTGKLLAEFPVSNPDADFAAFSPDGMRLAVASEKSVTVFDWQAGFAQGEMKARVRLVGHTDQIWSVAFSPDSRWVLTAGGNPAAQNSSSDNTARIWDAQTGKEVRALRGHTDRVSSAAFSRDGKFVVTASADKTARIWNAATGAPVTELRGHAAGVVRAQFSPDGKRVLTFAVGETTARVWDAQTGKEVAVLRGHTDAIIQAAFSANGEKILTTSRDGTARGWSVTGERSFELRGTSGAIYGAQFSPDSRAVLTIGGCGYGGDCDNVARLWSLEVRGPRVVLEMRGHTSWLNAGAFSADGNLVATASDDGTARVWDITPGVSSVIVQPLDSQNGMIYAVGVSPDGARLVTAESDNRAHVWDTQTGKMLRELNGHASAVYDATFSPDGRWIATASADTTARIWDAATGRLFAQLAGHSKAVRQVIFSPDNRRIVTVSDDGTARLWNASDGQSIEVLRGYAGIIWRAAFSPNGKLIVTVGTDSIARLWDADTGKAVADLRGHSKRIVDAQFTPDGKFLVTASDDLSARVWQIETGRAVMELVGHTTPLNRIAISPDSRTLLTAADDNVVLLWDLTTGKSLGALEGHREKVNHATFSADSKIVVTASSDGTARVWDVNSRRVLLNLRGHARQVEGAYFTPDGRRIVTLTYDDVRVFDCIVCGSLDDLVMFARTRVTRQLACEERRTYLHEIIACPTPTPTR